MRVRDAVVFGAALLAYASRASAETNDERRAQALFDEAVSLAARGRYVEACPLLEESQRLDPGLGTQFNIADCYEHTGRRASAWTLFDEVARQAHASGKDEREKLARARADALAPTLARIVIRAPSLPRDAVVRRDGTMIAPENLGRAMPVDAGEHVVEASAFGRVPFRTVVRSVDGALAEVVLPELAVARDAHAAPSAPQPTNDAMDGRRVAALGVAGAGVIALGIGSVFGVLAITRHDDAAAVCPDPNDCSTEAGAQKWTDASTAGDVSTVAFVISGVALAGAAVLWLTAPRTTARTSARFRFELAF